MGSLENLSRNLGSYVLRTKDFEVNTGSELAALDAAEYKTPFGSAISDGNTLTRPLFISIG
jgi:hypothetical protein